MNLTDAFPAARYRFEFQVCTPIVLHDYGGSALRGAFGHALRHIACITQAPDCKACALHRTCAYPEVFETPPPLDYTRRQYSNIPNPFVIEPPPWGARTFAPGTSFEFAMILIGPALRHLPLIVMALKRAFAGGIAKNAGTAQLSRVWLDGAPDPIMDGPNGRLREHSQQLAITTASPVIEKVSIEFQTPLRLQREGEVLGAGEVTARDLLMALLRRVANVTEMHLHESLDVDFPAMNRAATAIESRKELEWRSWTRYSQRQRREMQFSGLVGRWTLQGDLNPFWPLLYLGQWLHVGKNTTFGLGRYAIVSPQMSAAEATP